MKLKIIILILLVAVGNVVATDGAGFTRPTSIAAILGHDQRIKLLGHDPRMALLGESDGEVVASPSGRRTIYLHGFGANRDAARRIKTVYGSQRLPGDIWTFDFADAVHDAAMDTAKSSLGQWSDMRVALYVLNHAYERGEREVGINAHSRGGATAVNMVAALVDRAGTYDARLSEIGIDLERKAALVEMLRRGHIVLECPLVDVRAVLKHNIATASRRSWWARLFGSNPSAASFAASADYAAPVVLKEYRPWQEQAIKSAENWGGAGIPTIVHFQQEDEVLGNARDVEFFTNLSASNGATHTHRHVGRDGGHNSSFRSFEVTRNRFLREHGAAYKLPDDELK